MNHSDQDLKRILEAFRDAEPPRAMQQRVLAAVEQRSDAPLLIFPWSFASLTVAAVVVLVVAIYFVPRGLHGHSASAMPAELSVSQVVSPVPRPLVIPNSARASAHVRVVTASRRSHQLLCDCDPTALAEANAPSLPAPELPLTEQEKLLRRVARHPDSVQVAQLTAAAREASLAADHDDFKKFFTPPPGTPAPE